MQYTIRNVPAEIDRALRRRARREGKSINELTLRILADALQVPGSAAPRRKLSDLAGSWQEDPEFDAAIADQRRVDPELWR